jgi:hypothetical protein
MFFSCEFLFLPCSVRTERWFISSDRSKRVYMMSRVFLQNCNVSRVALVNRRQLVPQNAPSNEQTAIPVGRCSLGWSFYFARRHRAHDSLTHARLRRHAQRPRREQTLHPSPASSYDEMFDDLAVKNPKLSKPDHVAPVAAREATLRNWQPLWPSKRPEEAKEARKRLGVIREETEVEVGE